MSPAEILTILIALAALIVSVVSLVKTSENASQNTRLSNGNLEIQVREMISSARRYLSSCLHDKAVMELNLELKKNEELQKKIEQLIDAAFQDYVNAYEEACMKYIDNKIDRERFKKTYIKEITNLVTKNEEMFGVSSVYTAIKKVYNEWNDLEK